MTTILDGKSLAARLREQVVNEAADFINATGQLPTIALLRVGNDSALVSHAKSVRRSFEAAGFGFREQVLEEGAGQAELATAVTALNDDSGVHGILIQEPLPKGVDGAALVRLMDPRKDVDGVHPLNAGLLQQQTGQYHVPSTPLGGLVMLEEYGIDIKGKRAVVIGRSDIVGKPMAMLLLHRHATVTIAHSRTQHLAQVCADADIVCAAVGKAGLVTKDFIKPGAIVVDFGINFVEGKLVGDVAYDEVAEVAGAVTPTPGGTGPVTAVMLLRNTLNAARWLAGDKD